MGNFIVVVAEYHGSSGGTDLRTACAAALLCAGVVLIAIAACHLRKAFRECSGRLLF